MTNPPPSSERGRGLRLAARTVLTAATAAAFVGAASLSASAAPANEGTVTARVNVDSVITLALDQAGFTLNGTPTSTVDQTGAITGTVTTNNAAGYSVGVVAQAATLQPTLTGNTDTIPIGNLKVHNAAGVYTALSNNPLTPVITTTKTSRSALDGDDFSDDYQVIIPDVNSDAYTVQLDYTATALA
jgi:hypothetical protein